MAASSTSAVLTALIGNGFLTVLKFGVWSVSGSGAMFSEAIHTLADTSNQALLFLGIRRSERSGGSMFPYGRGAERYFFALISAMGIFVLGCGVTVYHGVHTFLHPPEEITVKWWLFAVLAISFVVDGWVFMCAWRAVKQQKGSQSLRAFMKENSDPTAVAVLLEDLAACAGVLLALLGIGLAVWTGDNRWDAMASITIGLMLGAIAIWIGVQNRTLLIGRSIPDEVREKIVAYMRKDPVVERVTKTRTLVLGAENYKVACDVDFDGRLIGRRLAPVLAERAGELAEPDQLEELAADLGERVLEELAVEIDRIEAELKELHPELTHLALEADE